MAIHLSGSLALTGSTTIGVSQTNTGTLTSIVGGTLNTASGACSFIGGGCCNSNSGGLTSIVGGWNNTSSGTYSFIGGGLRNFTENLLGFVGSGVDNCARGNYSAIVGGSSNVICSQNYQFIGGGLANENTGGCTSIVGGKLNLATGTAGFLGGGEANTSSADFSMIGAGRRNYINSSAVSSSILGGFDNTSNLENTHIIGSGITADKANYAYVNNLDVETSASAVYFSGSFVGDGSSLTLPSGVVSSSAQILPITTSSITDFPTEVSRSAAANGFGGGADDDWYDGTTFISSSVGIQVDGNITGSGCLVIGACHTGSGISYTIAGGRNNTICNNCSFIGGGCRNEVHDGISGIVSGRYNCINGGGGSLYNMIGAGQQNCITGSSSNFHNFIGSGIQNRICDVGTAFIGTGNSNCIIASSGVIVGGIVNKIDSTNAFAAFIGGGTYINNRGRTGVVGGGCKHLLTGDFSIIGGGCQNTSSGDYSGILGGTGNTVSNNCSFIIGANITSDKNCYTFMNNLDVEGTVSASIFSGSFVGDGTNLTGVTATLPAGVVSSSAQILPITTSSITDFPTEVSRSAAASGFGSSGGGGGVTIANDANNRITTAVGDGSLNAEANLTFDGSTLVVTSEMKATGKIVIGGGTSTGTNSSIAGGDSTNTISADYGFIGSGVRNEISQSGASGIVAGADNTIKAYGINAGAFCNFIGSGQFNNIAAHGNSCSLNFNAIVGGYSNAISSSNDNHRNIIGGGHENLICNTNYGGILGGANNTITNLYSIIGGGHRNKAEGNWSVVVGGHNNTGSASRSFIGGGARNCINSSAISSSILGGFDNTTNYCNTHLIGSDLTADKENYTFVNNLDAEGTVSASIFSGSFVGDGSGLTGISGGGGGCSSLPYSPYITGSNHNLGIIPSASDSPTTLGAYSTIAGGRHNEIKSTSTNSFIGSGCKNCLTQGMSFIGAGCQNTGSTGCTFIGAGRNNFNRGSSAGIVAGWGNKICNVAYYGFIGAGQYNHLVGGTQHSAIVGGCNNVLEDNTDRSIIGAGLSNTICDGACCSGILGGTLNIVDHDKSFIIGSNITSSAACTTYVNNFKAQGPSTGTTVVILENLPTSDPNNAGQLWNDSGTLKVSAG